MELKMRKEQLRRLTWLMESCIRIPGTQVRLGLDALVGLVPLIGDIAGLVIGLFYLAVAIETGVKKRDLFCICFWFVMDALIGTLPILGDLFDLGFRAHQKAFQLLESKYWQKLSAAD